MKKIISVLLAAVLLLSAFSGCAGFRRNDSPDVPPAPSPEPTPEASAEPYNPLALPERDYAKALAAYDEDMVVGTVNGLEVKWDEYFFWCVGMLMSLENYVGAIEDFSEDFGGMSYGEYIKTSAENNCCQYRAVEYFAAKEGIELTDEDEELLDIQLQSDIGNYAPGGTEEDFNAYLTEHQTNRRIYDYSNRMSMLYNRAYKEYCGESGEKLSEDEVMSFADMSGLLTAKHILLKTVEEDRTTPLSDEVKAEKLALAKELIERLDAGEDFDSLMSEYSEDPGSAAYPLGYLFGAGQMVPEFEEAAMNLAVGEYTKEPVESSYGYHVILRPGFDDDMIYMGESVTLRQMAANEKFNGIFNEWFEASEMVYAPGFDIDMAELFPLIKD